MTTRPALPDGPMPLVDLAAYADGSVVSNTLVKGAAGTVTIFAFDAGEGLSEHTAPYDALVIAIDGTARFTINAVAHALQAGDVLRLPAGAPHALEATTPFKMLLVMIRASADGA